MSTIEDIFNRCVAEDEALYRTTQPRYRYFTDHKGNRYFWTVEKINHNGNPKYVAGVYRYLKTKNQYKLVKQSGFGKRSTAKDRAWKWSTVAKATKNNS